MTNGSRFAAALVCLAVAASLVAWFLVGRAHRQRASDEEDESGSRAGASLRGGGPTDDPGALHDDGASPANSPAASSVPILDRQKRDQVRALIWRSFGQDPPDAATTTAAYVLPEVPPWPEAPGDGGFGAIEPKYIQEKVRNEFFPLARQCYATLTTRIPDAGGSAVLAFDIVGNKNIGGIVEQVDVLNRSTLRDPEFVDCMRQSFLSVTFPPPEGGGMVTVEYPIVFSPEDP